MKPNREIQLYLGVTMSVFGVGLARAPADEIDVGRGPVTVHVPASYDPASPMPLVLALHGRTGSGAGLEASMGLIPLADEYGVLLALPDGTRDPNGESFWNATDVCCDNFNTNVDDSGYLRDLIERIKGRYAVDPRRVFVTGHSKGGFMAYRLACDHSEAIAAIASLAGATFGDASACQPSSPVHVLQVHGTADDIAPYDAVGAYPGAPTSVRLWAEYNACSLAIEGGAPGCGDRQRNPCDESIPPLDLDPSLAGRETVRTRYGQGCDLGGSAELWTVRGGTHAIHRLEHMGRRTLEWLLDGHEKTDCNANGVPDEQDILSGASADCNEDGFPDECEPDCNGNGIPDSCDIASGTSQDRDEDGLPDECDFELVGLMDGVGPDANTFISPASDNVAFERFTLQATEDLVLNSAAPVGNRRGQTGVDGVVRQANGVYEVLFNRKLTPGNWLKVTLGVTGESSGRRAIFELWVAHHPGAINQDGTVDIRDASTFGDLFRNDGPAALLDLNADGVVDIQDATTFGEIWRGEGSQTQPWAGYVLPSRPE